MAVRTMGCIRVEKITEYLCNPLRQTLKDPVSQAHTHTRVRARPAQLRPTQWLAARSDLYCKWHALTNNTHWRDGRQDPYVRKTAAVCVAKLFDISPELVTMQGFLELLHDLVSDSNPTVRFPGV